MITFPFDAKCKENAVFSYVMVGQYRRLTMPLYVLLGMVIVFFLIYEIMVVIYLSNNKGGETSPNSMLFRLTGIAKVVGENSESSTDELKIAAKKSVETDNSAFVSAVVGLIFAILLLFLYSITTGSLIHAKLKFEHTNLDE